MRDWPVKKVSGGDSCSMVAENMVPGRTVMIENIPKRFNDLAKMLSKQNVKNSS